MDLDHTASTCADMAFFEVAKFSNIVNAREATIKTYLWTVEYMKKSTMTYGPSLNEVREFLKTENLLPAEFIREMCPENALSDGSHCGDNDRHAKRCPEARS